MKEINIVEAPTGAGKTSAAINYMRGYRNTTGDNDTRFMFITPFLREIERVKACAAEMRFCEPQARPSKTADIKRCIRRNNNVASTHKLLSLFDTETIDLLENRDYILVLDETMKVFDNYDVSEYDLRVILDKYGHVDDKGLLVWDHDQYNGKFDCHKWSSLLQSVGLYGNNTENSKLTPFWMLPVNIFKSFKEVWILTYMFETQMQRYYYDLWGLQYKYWGVSEGEYLGGGDSTFRFVPGRYHFDAGIYADKIHIVDSYKLNRIGNDETALSKSWYTRQNDSGLLNDLRNNTYNFFRHYTDTSSNENMWTTFVNFRNDIKGKGYTKGFLPLNMRATNEYQHKRSVAYLANIYPNPMYANFLRSYGVEMDLDAYATSEMIQFIFRAAVRRGEEITVYIPSSRMRGLLEKWLRGDAVVPGVVV